MQSERNYLDTAFDIVLLLLCAFTPEFYHTKQQNHTCFCKNNARKHWQSSNSVCREALRHGKDAITGQVNTTEMKKTQSANGKIAPGKAILAVHDARLIL